ncbi:MAG TPA: hypothetical protein VG099_08755 [Gemmataceae bacterium]|nr:hypothetical protein [Gemmataceae bacterium]
MHESKMTLDELHTLARQGDLQAHAEICRRLKAHMPRLVRHALRPESPPTRGNLAIREAAAAAARQAVSLPTARPAGRLQRFTRRLLEMVGHHSRADGRPDLRDTVRC